MLLLLDVACRIKLQGAKPSVADVVPFLQGVQYGVGSVCGGQAQMQSIIVAVMLFRHGLHKVETGGSKVQ